jgi:NADH-dependent peroxiredoxin subunit F
LSMYDLIIIGAGPAGITASVYAARQKMKFLVLTSDVGGQAAWSGDIENYTGYQFITGPELAEKFQAHLRKFDIGLKENEPVESLEKKAGRIVVRTNKGEYEARCVIIAAGKKSRELGVPGEKEYKNKGLTYCATCDGPLFAGKDVAVVGGGNSALDAAIQLEKIARNVAIINISDKLTADAMMQEYVLKNPRIAIYHNSRVTEVLGDKMVTGIKIENSGRQELLSVQGVFVEAGLIPNSAFAQGLDKNALGEIKINLRNETNIPGMFAAGDVTDVADKQIIIAAGEGAKAALSVARYLINNPA